MELEREAVGERQWLALLAGRQVGRLVYTVGALPAVLPVRFRLQDDGSLLLRVPVTVGLGRALDRAVVAFEAGDVSETDGGGWSVTVLGHASATPGAGTVRLRAELVTGRRLAPAARAEE
ncbi:pyridoxamine 5'-phosphate oxidase family protein [Kitasatospora sp. NPDC001547]|uniref:pyridoxamine 5'-phosphate oxidase family protein n=1 Tax=Kitasatospora sp. NPDC001547 TaxID=3364015 RepID=UPI003696CE65|nr:pyridoxamine 5'-phosphate oxidase family protein [Kitasatospora sp. Xyl93]